MLESQSPRWCYSTEDFNERQIDGSITIEENIIPEWFFYPIVKIVKNIESLKITFVHINQHIEPHYHVLFARMYTLVFIVVINLTPHFHSSVM